MAKKLPMALRDLQNVLERPSQPQVLAEAKDCHQRLREICSTTRTGVDKRLRNQCGGPRQAPSRGDDGSRLPRCAQLRHNRTPRSQPSPEACTPPDEGLTAGPQLRSMR